MTQIQITYDLETFITCSTEQFCSVICKDSPESFTPSSGIQIPLQGGFYLVLLPTKQQNIKLSLFLHNNILNFHSSCTTKY